MKVLVVGGGGREHALAWKLAQSERVTQVLVAPGNAGTAIEPKVANLALSADDLDGLIAAATDHEVGLVVVGPEGPLAAGLVDRMQAAGLRCFGPSQAAAELEASKAFTKEFLVRHSIPTAAYGAFVEVSAALEYLESFDGPFVVKADGLAAGKGVIVTESRDEAATAVRDMLQGNSFGTAGHRVVIEEFLAGEEASFIAIVDGENVLPLASSQDHKRALDGDAGMNTGGMGAYSPAPIVDSDMQQRVIDEVMLPTVRGMAAEGRSFTGFLYAGLMIDKQGVPKVLEFNVRMGDPETQPIMHRLQTDLVDVLEAALDRQLATIKLTWDTRFSVGVVMAAGGYPSTYATGDLIHGLDCDFGPAVKVFHAGTRLTDHGVVTAGGRVLCVCGMGEQLSVAQTNAYCAVSRIEWTGVQYRRDIGSRGIVHLQQGGADA